MGVISLVGLGQKIRPTGMRHTHPLKYNIILDVILFIFLRFSLEQNWIWCLHMTLQFPGGFFWTKVLPLHLYLPNGVIPKQYLPPLEDTIRFHQKISSGFHLHIVPIYNMSSIMYILFWIERYEKHYETSNLAVKPVDMPPVPFWTVFQKAHNIGVLTSHKFLI